MGFRKGQAALDFLMTYGWAIALVVIIAAVLFSLGIFDVTNFIGSKAAGFSGVGVTGWRLDPGGVLYMKLVNEVGQPISVNSVNATISGVTQENPVAITPATLGTGEMSNQINIPGFANSTAGTGYTAQVVITYVDKSSGFNYTTTGTLTGKST